MGRTETHHFPRRCFPIPVPIPPPSSPPSPPLLSDQNDGVKVSHIPVYSGHPSRAPFDSPPLASLHPSPRRISMSRYFSSIRTEGSYIAAGSHRISLPFPLITIWQVSLSCSPRYIVCRYSFFRIIPLPTVFFLRDQPRLLAFAPPRISLPGAGKLV